jgi:alkanesulfonate monooxygenase SsuD/methylene tetrahydromethanopterin reductase-like flavin-dependent oxidoreductase (luciferase family)
MAQIGIMIEAQEDLTWNRWRRLCFDVEQLGYASLRRSDHLMSVLGGEDRDALDCWTSLALAAEWTNRIEFGPMVSPLTWHPPSLLAREAASVDVLSGGRLILGVGAGWHAAEHERFGFVLPPLKQRMDNYETGIETILRAWELTNPKPVRAGRVPILLGGSGGEKRGLRIIAKYADEWNLTNASPDIYRHKLDVFLEHCRAVGRDPSTIRRSTLHTYLIGASEKEVLERAAMVREVMPELKDLEPRELIEAKESLWLIGTPERIAEKMAKFIDLGVDLFVFAHLLQDDREALELLATVIPQVA